MTSIQPVSDYKNKFCSLDPVLIGKGLPVGMETFKFKGIFKDFGKQGLKKSMLCIIN